MNSQNGPSSFDTDSHATTCRWLHGFVVVLIVATFALLILGGSVTSKGAGMAVPDWPNSYGYNMFLFPISMWQGGVFWEHTHRLFASGVGFLTILLAVFLWKTQKTRRWLRWMGLAMLFLVILQGVMGGLRVVEVDWRYGVVHGILAQIFLCGLVLIAAAVGSHWHLAPAKSSTDARLHVPLDVSKPKRWAKVFLAILLIQLSLGAAVRHSRSGLAIPDFPAFYGQWYPPLTAEALEQRLNAIPYEELSDLTDQATISQVLLHATHRLGAVVVVGGLVMLLVSLKDTLGDCVVLRNPALLLVGLLIMQLMLGAGIIWSGRHPEIATAHQVTGAAMLAGASLLLIRLYRLEDALPLELGASTCDEKACSVFEGGAVV